MVTEPTPTSHTERIGFVITSAGTHYTGITAGLILGVPIVAFLSGNATLLFYVHIGLGAFGSGSIIFFFFRYVMAPVLKQAGPETATSIIPHLTPKIMVVGESLTLGTIGRGLGSPTALVTGRLRQCISGGRSAWRQ